MGGGSAKEGPKRHEACEGGSCLTGLGLSAALTGWPWACPPIPSLHGGTADGATWEIRAPGLARGPGPAAHVTGPERREEQPWTLGRTSRVPAAPETACLPTSRVVRLPFSPPTLQLPPQAPRAFPKPPARLHPAAVSVPAAPETEPPSAVSPAAPGGDGNTLTASQDPPGQDGLSALLDVTWMGPGLAPQASSPGSDQQPGLICRRGRSPGQAGAKLTLGRGRLGKGKLHGHVRAPRAVMPSSENNDGLWEAGDRTSAPLMSWELPPGARLARSCVRTQPAQPGAGDSPLPPSASPPVSRLSPALGPGDGREGGQAIGRLQVG